MARQYVRIVALRRGRLKATEFRLRENETGLSIFELDRDTDVRGIIAAVRATGKQGDLAAAALAAEDFESLGLKIVCTSGRTPDPEINSLHREARLSLIRRIAICCRGRDPAEHFNRLIAPQLCVLARLIHTDEGSSAP